MTTEDALNLLSLRLDQPLTAEQHAALDAWLAESPDHRILAEAFQTQHGELQQTFAPRRAAAQQTAATVVAQLNTVVPASPPARWRRILAPLPAACAAALMIAGGLYFFRVPKTETPKAVEVAAADPYGLLGMKPRSKPAAPQATSLVVGESVATKAGEKRLVTLPDGSMVYLNQNTSIELAKDRHLKLVAGDVFVEAVPADTKPNLPPFQVETPKRSVTALGTMFAVSAREQGTGVLVTQGKVEVSGLDTKLTSGQELLPNDKIVTTPRVATALDWTRDLMVAAESPLVPAGKYSGGSLVAVDPYGQEAKLALVKFHVDVHIEDGFARTTIDQTYFNSENRQMEGTFYFPLPPDASLSRLAMYVDGERMEGGMAERDHARNVYETIRYQRRDPALLEWVDGSLFKMRVFPLEARQEKRIILSYTQKLPVLYRQVTYRFPAGHSLAMVNEWSFNAFVHGGAHMAANTPSHPTMKLQIDGNHLRITDQAKAVKVDRDVVVELTNHQEQATSEVYRWSGAEQDGQRYLMLRYRPELPTTPKRERRDWVFLFESSGNRDPLVARAQVEVIRALLTRAEHDDTFAILRVGTRVRSYAATPLPATIENVNKALTWLESAHLIGALNLDQAFSEATPLLQNGRNPHLVHVGGGIASIGEQRADELVKRIPTGTKYVGVAVGKRFSPALMKTAAEKTGGLFTQINPDEPITWRGFELASTLNAPRLLNVTITADGPNAPRFLTFSNIITHGEEIAAVANVTHGTPTHVIIKGLLDGVPVERSIRVENVAPQANYLPRTWAKLEIERLLAANSQVHKKTIIEMSKAMYVMTPFTSLLVLENEQMYREFNVDRGRKDHWAMYQCPPKIPVVYIPDPNQPASSVNLKGQKPHANQVQQTIVTRVPPNFLTWPNRHGREQSESMIGLGTLGEIDVGEIDGGMTWSETSLSFQGMMGRSAATRDRLLSAGGGNNLRALRLGTDMRRERLWKAEPRSKENATSFDRFNRRDLYAIEQEEFLLRDAEPVLEKRKQFQMEQDDRRSVYFGDLEAKLAESTNAQLSAEFNAPVLTVPSPDWAVLDNKDRELLFQMQGRMKVLQEFQAAKRRTGMRSEQWNWEQGNELFESRAIRQATNGRVNRDESRLMLDALEVDFKQLKDSQKRPRTSGGRGLDDEKEKLGLSMGRRRLNEAPQYYGRVSFSNQSNVFTDLPAYAPGMNTSLADRLATVEAEAQPRLGLKRGQIDPAARTLLSAARSAEWRRTKIKVDQEQTFEVQHDMQGRYTYERRLPLGLMEYVVCDGTTLWHLYPEIGLGAKRPVSRFHRATIQDVVPDFIPPVDELNVGYDVKAIDAKTVALIPIPPANPEDAPQRWLETHLVLEGGKLLERRTVLMPKKLTVTRIVFDAHGSAKEIIAKGKDEPKDTEIELLRRERTPMAAPNLQPDVRALVVLPFPLRDRQTVYQEFGLDANQDLGSDRNGCYEYLDEESVLRLIACEWGANNGYNVYRLANRCFFEKRADQRGGFFALAQASGFNVHDWSMLIDQADKNLNNKLLRYLRVLNEPRVLNWTIQFGFGVPSTPPTTFLDRLLTFRRIQLRWQGGYIRDAVYGEREEERQRALAFAEANADNVLGWCVAGMVQDQVVSEAGFAAVAKTWGVLADKAGMTYDARYEQARCLGRAGQSDEAQQKYQTLFREALAEGVLPPLDASFRNVLERGKQEAWAKLMQETAAKCAEKKVRPVIVTLAWQCNQLGDTVLADVLLSYALKEIPGDEKPITLLAATHFLHQTGRYDRAEQLVRELLNDERLATSAPLWRLASSIAEQRGDAVRTIECLEKALDLEFAYLPDVFNVQPIRNDYGRLLNHYEWLANATTTLKVTAPQDLLARVVKAADRWRTLDPETDHVCDRVAKIFRTIGGVGSDELAWDYATTPLAMRPNESSPWLSLANTMRQEGRWLLTDKCYDMAFQAEPTNAQILWDRAQHLLQQGQTADGHALLKKITESTWQPRFDGVKAQARQVLEGR